MPAREAPVLGVDPGRRKCGLAVVARDGQVLAGQVVARESLRATVAAWVTDHAVQHVVVGDGTGSKAVLSELREVLGELPVTTVDEHGTTLAARARYWREHPPRGLWRLIPTSLRVPPVPFDDLVAAILADRWWAAQPAIER